MVDPVPLDVAGSSVSEIVPPSLELRDWSVPHGDGNVFPRDMTDLELLQESVLDVCPCSVRRDVRDSRLATLDVVNIILGADHSRGRFAGLRIKHYRDS